ncbi:MAG: UPF0164 family protein [Elusimicrobia bacterium]|jgi:hypothetical protein|nr:UPF0164 family protein [Elusimicrobiota bacterium]
MIKKVKLIFILVIFYAPAGILHASPGAVSGQILNIEDSAKVAALGGAYAGLSNDLNAVSYNPAGLAQIYGTEFQFTHVLYYLDTTINAFTYGQSLGKAGFGFKWKLLSAADTARDSSGAELDDFDIRMAQYSIGFGIPVAERHRLGAVMNILSEKFAVKGINNYTKDQTDGGVGFDIGWHYTGFRGSSYGIVIRNMGSGLKVADEEAPLPYQYVLAGAHKMSKFNFSWEAYTGAETSFAWKCGLEAELSDYFRARAGLSVVTKTDFTLGFGIPYDNWDMDYAFFPHQDMGLVHRVSLGVHF